MKCKYVVVKTSALGGNWVYGPFEDYDTADEYRKNAVKRQKDDEKGQYAINPKGSFGWGVLVAEAPDPRNTSPTPCKVCDGARR